MAWATRRLRYEKLRVARPRLLTSSRRSRRSSSGQIGAQVQPLRDGAHRVVEVLGQHPGAALARLEQRARRADEEAAARLEDGLGLAVLAEATERCPHAEDRQQQDMERDVEQRRLGERGEQRRLLVEAMHRLVEDDGRFVAPEVIDQGQGQRGVLAAVQAVVRQEIGIADDDDGCVLVAEAPGKDALVAFHERRQPARADQLRGR